MNETSYLMPKGFRPLGLVLVVMGAILAVARYSFNYKPDFLELRMYALYSAYVETKINTLITNQMAEEIAGILVLIGLLFFAMAKENVESEMTSSVRLKAFVLSAYLNVGFLLISFLVTFGFGFVFALILFMNWWLISYYLIFKYLLYKEKRAKP